jgi:glycosyltransferase involved in cell wall biosynthesis
MKIVHVCLTGGYTEGIGYQENYLTKYHALDGNKVTVITTQYCWHKNVWGKCAESGYLNTYGVYVVRLQYKWAVPYKLNTYIGKFVGLYDELKKQAPDIIFIHNLQFQDIKVIRKYKKKNPGVKIYVDNHSDFNNSARNWLSRTLLYKMYWKGCARAIEPCTEKFYGVLPARVDFLTDVYGLPKEKCELLVMGADDEAVERVLAGTFREDFRKQHGIADDDFLIMTGGKIDAFKQQTLLLMEAVRNLESNHVKLCVFGSVEEDIMPKLKKLCVGEKVQYIGWAQGEQAYEYFIAADLVVFPGSHSVYWEQVAGLGIPMICKYWKGMTHIDIGGNVKFLKEDSVEEIQNLLELILENPDEYNHMLEMAMGEGKTRFSYKKIARQCLIGED